MQGANSQEMSSLAKFKKKFYNEAYINPYYNPNDLDKALFVAWIIGVPCSILIYFLSY
jgi:hypothetical protein